MSSTLTSKTRSRGRRTGGTYRSMAEINVTPFVDIMLVLLIMFIVTAPLLTAGVNVDLPKSKANPIQQEDNKPIEVSIKEDGTIFIGETEVKEGNLVGLLSAIAENGAEQRIYVRGDQTLDYGLIMKVIGQINAAGYSKVALISEPVP